MNVDYVLQNLNIPDCKSKKNKAGRFYSGEALKQHCTNVDNWHHSLILFFIRKLFEPEAAPYVDDTKKLRPSRDGTEFYDGTVNSTSRKTSVFNVRG